MKNVKLRRILVTGVAGYLGSCTAYALLERGYEVIGVDSMLRGRGEPLHLLSSYKSFQMAKLDLAEELERLAEIMSLTEPQGVIHFAALALVGESMREPYTYLRNNVLATLNLLEAMRRADVKLLVFSSSAAVYGTPKKVPISEDSPLEPINPYGYSKLISEKLIESYSLVHPLKYVNLRYFNPAGAYEGSKGLMGELHYPETHLIPKLISSAMTSTEFHIYGDDYPTKDGTPVRDLIHVRDLVEAHLLSLEGLARGTLSSGSYNVGSGVGYTVKEVVNTAERLLGKFPVRISPRRPGDPPILVADTDKLRKALGFKPSGTLEDMMLSAEEFMRRWGVS